MKVLVVVEDDRDMQLLIRVVLGADDRLELAGSASTAAEAERMAEAEQPDLVVLDHFIDGDVMGLQAAPAIKRAAPRSRILLFTSHDLALEAEREHAVDGYLNKRDMSDLLPTVQRLLRLPRAA